MGSILFDRNIAMVKREGGDGGARNAGHQWRCRLLGQNDIWRENVSCHIVLTRSSGYRWAHQ